MPFPKNLEDESKQGYHNQDVKMPSRVELRDDQKQGYHDKVKMGTVHHHGGIVIRKRANGNIKPMRFVSLHHHSTLGSYLDAVGLPDAHVRRATELQMGRMALTEHGNVDSHARFDKAAEKAGIKPIFGCEVYMPTTSMDKDGNRVLWSDPNAQTQRKHHLTIIAETPEGYRNLLRLVTASFINFYHDPIVSWDDLVAHKEGLIILSGCQGSLLFCATVGGKGIPPEQASYKRGLRIAQMFRREFGDKYFIEVQAFPELEETCRFNPLAARIARATGARLVATMDCHYTALEEAEVQKILHNLRPGSKQTLEEQARSWGYKAPLCPPPNDMTIWRKLKASGLTAEEAVSAIVSTEEIADQCTATMPRVPMIRFPVERATHGKFLDIEEYWKHLLNEGWKFRGFHKLPPAQRKVYMDRLKYEEKLIRSKDFIDYFLLVRYGVVRIKDEGIPVGPARGSAAASLLAYVLRITEVNPLRPEFAGLLRFERFISEDREDLPDIDLDFPGSSRPRLRAIYIELMGGPEFVNNVGTFTQFKGKNSLDSIARVFGVPKFEVDTIKDFLIERSSGDMRASSTVEDTINQFEKPRGVLERFPDLAKASWLEGNLAGFGVHAAALVLSNQPITNFTAVVEREVPKGSKNWITCVALDKKDAERLGLIKMDFLGLNTMEMIWRCLRWLGKDLDWLYNLPLNDPRVYAMLQAVDVTGVFQFEGRSQRYVCSMIKPEKFSEIMDCGALCRPGPLHNGAARMYGEIKQGGKIATARHPAVAKLLTPTQFQIVYQEQILEIARVIGGFDARGVGEIRTIIAKKEGEQAFERAREEFIKGARTLHIRFPEFPPMSDEIANIIFGDCVTSGAYAFNAAHCAAYGLISYFTAYLKVYEPDVFYASALAESIKDKDRTRQLLRDAEHHGIRILKPNLQTSGPNWEPKLVHPNRPANPPRVVRAGFQSVEGIGEKVAPMLSEWRDARRPTGWGQIQELKGFGPKTVLKITDWIKQDDPFGAFKLDNDIRVVKEMIKAGQLLGRDGRTPLPTPTHNASDLALDEHQGKSLHVYWLGTFVQRNIRDIFEQNRARGVVLDPSKTKDPHLAEWAMLTGEDESDQLLIKIDRWHFPKFKEAIFEFRMGRDLLLIQGVKPARSGVRSLNVKKLWVINPDD
jgi:DNA polymerase-3 subunit alpha